MRIAVVGTGYVGLVTGTCLADSGNRVTCVDIDAGKIARLERGEIPMYEPGLEELVDRNLRAGRLRFTTDLAAAIHNAGLVFLAVGTPQAADGSANLDALWGVIDALAEEGRTMLLVTHELGFAYHVATRVIFLADGTIHETGTPDEVLKHPRQERTRAFLASHKRYSL